ncbi:IS21 family transposase, partial [Lactobacillus reuteri]|nr:IS21 family transposase [Limosilactobacillus reuteri]
YDYEFDNVNDLAQLIHKLNVQLNNELSQATGEKPNTLWTKEKEYLLPFDKNLLLSIIDRDQTRKVSNESMITYKGNKYSVP